MIQRIKKVARLIILAGSASSQAQTQNNAAFLSLFEGEVQNRAFALMFVQREEKFSNVPEQKELWKSYIEFEELNQFKFKPYADKYKFDMKPNLKSRFKAIAANMASKIFQETLFKITTESTIDYVEDLEKLAQLSMPQERNFFNYVVVQEKVQVTVLQLLNQKKWTEAAKVFTDFVKTHKNLNDLSIKNNKK